MSLNDLVSYSTIAQTRDPFQPYQTDGWGKGGKPKPPIPEASTYGALMMFSVLTLLMYSKYLKRNDR